MSRKLFEKIFIYIAIDNLITLYFAQKLKHTMTDIEIAQKATLKHIKYIAEKLGVAEDDLEMYGKYKAKLPLNLIQEAPKGNLILVTALTPTPAGEGKTTVSIGLHEGLCKIGKKSVVVLREPSLGPVFGIKGGAAGGGHSQVIPMEDINLHFTGDFAAIEKANNLLAALIDNNIQSNRSIGIDPKTVIWKRVIDMNDRALRDIIIGVGPKANGTMRQDGFNITAASEIMAILCMAKNIDDLKEKMGNIFIGYTYDKKPVYARDLNAENAMAILLKDAIKPNLVQTLEGNPAIIHGGPFANIAQGTNTIIATKMGLSLADYVVTEAGFGADLGAEKFLNIKCGYGNLNPKAVVIVATIRALRHHGGAQPDEYNTPSLERVEKGFANLEKHLENMGKFGLPRVVAINNFYTDTKEEIDLVIAKCAAMGVQAVLSKGWADGGEGTKDLATAVIKAMEHNTTPFQKLYDWNLGVKEKIETIATEIYGADGVDYTTKAASDIRTIEKLGLANLPICMAKTQKSFTDDEKRIGRPTGFRITVREFEIAAGAGFLIPILGNMMRMPGLPATPASEGMTIDANGKIAGLS
jgi:formate--tetrahydrofolate ligase